MKGLDIVKAFSGGIQVSEIPSRQGKEQAIWVIPLLKILRQMTPGYVQKIKVETEYDKIQMKENLKRALKSEPDRKFYKISTRTEDGIHGKEFYVYVEKLLHMKEMKSDNEQRC